MHYADLVRVTCHASVAIQVPLADCVDARPLQGRCKAAARLLWGPRCQGFHNELALCPGSNQALMAGTEAPWYQGGTGAT